MKVGPQKAQQCRWAEPISEDERLAIRPVRQWEKKPRRGLNCIVSSEHLRISWLTSTSARQYAIDIRHLKAWPREMKSGLMEGRLIAKRMQVESPEPTKADSQMETRWPK